MDVMRSRLTRLAGLLYLLMLPTIGAPFLFSAHLQAGGPDELVGRIQASRQIFELAIIGSAAGFVVFLFLGLAFYRLLAPAGKGAAAALFLLVAASIPISLMAIASWMDILSLLPSGAGSAPNEQMLQAEVVRAMQTYDNLMLVSAIFWGLWLAPLGWLIYRSRIAPRILGVLLMVGSPYYVLSFAGTVITPDYQTTPFAMIAGLAFGLPSVVGELGTALWLLIVGAGKAGRTQQAATIPKPET